jgi:hypothetical protein
MAVRKHSFAVMVCGYGFAVVVCFRVTMVCLLDDDQLEACPVDVELQLVVCCGYHGLLLVRW